MTPHSEIMHYHVKQQAPLVDKSMMVLNNGENNIFSFHQVDHNVLSELKKSLANLGTPEQSAESPNSPYNNRTRFLKKRHVDSIKPARFLDYDTE